MGWWMLCLLGAMSVSLLDGHVPEWMLPALAAPIVVAGVVGSFVIHRRGIAKSAGFTVHWNADTTLIEQRSSGTVTTLTRENLELGVYAYTVRGGRYSLPTVIARLGDRALVLGAPPGFVATGHEAQQTGTATAFVDDPEAWRAILAATGRLPEGA